jgi:hypothetical protein
MQLRDRQEISASVVFFFIPQLKEQEPNISYCALISLHKILKEQLLLERSSKLKVLSSISGAIVIIPDLSNIYIHQHLLIILDDCKNQGIPIRLGITHGHLEVLEDVDTLLGFVGKPMNIAARLSTSDKNKGILYHSKYIDFVQALPSLKINDPLHPRFCNEVEIKGKPHDPVFNCRECDDNLALSQFDRDFLPESNKYSISTINGIAIAYDLPKYSQGDRSELSKRFRSVIDSIRQIITRSIFSGENNQFFFSPGGDGGIIILPIKQGISLEEYIEIAFKLIETLEVESDSRNSNIDVKSRVGIHYGAVNLYNDAESILRPTGLTCFIADEIASDAIAKQKSGIVITEAIKDSLYRGNLKRFHKEYEPLPCLVKGAAKKVQRYAKKLDIQSQTNSKSKEQTINNIDNNPIIISPNKSSQEIWRDWKEQANLKSGWITFTSAATGINSSRRIANLQPIYEITKNELVYMEINLDYLQDRSLILLNSSTNQNDRVSGRYLVCPSWNFAPFPDNCRRNMRIPQPEANQSPIKQITFNTNAQEEFLAIVIDHLPNISWLRPNDREPFPELTDSRLKELWGYLNASDGNNWQIFHQSFDVK